MCNTNDIIIKAYKHQKNKEYTIAANLFLTAYKHYLIPIGNKKPDYQYIFEYLNGYSLNHTKFLFTSGLFSIEEKHRNLKQIFYNYKCGIGKNISNNGIVNEYISDISKNLQIICEDERYYWTSNFFRRKSNLHKLLFHCYKKIDENEKWYLLLIFRKLLNIVLYIFRLFFSFFENLFFLIFSSIGLILLISVIYYKTNLLFPSEGNCIDITFWKTLSFTICKFSHSCSTDLHPINFLGNLLSFIISFAGLIYFALFIIYLFRSKRN